MCWSFGALLPAGWVDEPEEPTYFDRGCTLVFLQEINFLETVPQPEGMILMVGNSGSPGWQTDCSGAGRLLVYSQITSHQLAMSQMAQREPEWTTEAEFLFRTSWPALTKIYIFRRGGFLYRWGNLSFMKCCWNLWHVPLEQYHIL